MAKPEGALFDCNGVIIDDYLLEKEAWNILSLELRNKPITDEEMLAYVLSIPTIEVARWITGGSYSEEELHALGERKRKVIDELSEDAVLYSLMPGIVGFFDQLAALKIPMTIVTSARESGTREYFDDFKLGRWFVWEKIIFNDGTHNNKPAPDPYILGAKNLGLNTSECVVFEDSPGGITSAFAAGSRNIVGVSSNLPSETLQKLPGVIKVIQDFYQVTPEKLFGV